MTSPSITRRLIVVLTLGILLFWGIAAVGVTYVFHEELDETFDLALRETAQRIMPLAIDDLTDRDDTPPRALAHAGKGRIEYLNYQLRDRAGAVLLQTPELVDAPADLYSGAPPEGFRNTEDYRTFSETDPATGYTLVVAETTSHRLEAISDSTRTLILPLIILIPLSAMIIWIAVRGTLRPVRRLSAEIARRDGGNLTPLDVSGQPAELRPIAEATARLVDRLRIALDAERAFAANSAHELRTPIAGALAQTQRLLVELGDNPGVERARQIEQALKRLARLSEKLLQLSRLDAGLAQSDAPTDLLPVLDLVVREAGTEPMGADRLRYSRGAGPALISRVDADAFAIAVRNLIENALKHGATNHPIDVVVEGQAIAVRNSGPAVPGEVLAGLRQRFTRGASEADGSGLGLAIVEAIAQQSGMRLELSSPAPGQADGFEARLTL